jgi:DNA repair exonuclease SbcCD ATPase subunit
MNKNLYEISEQFIPPLNLRGLHETKCEKSESDILSMNNTYEFNSYRLPFKHKNDLNTLRESDYSWNHKSKYYDDEDLLLASALHNASQTQDMIKDFLESETNVMNSARENKEDLKEEISALKDMQNGPIYRGLEDYKDLILKYRSNIENLENDIHNSVADSQNEISDFLQDLKSRSDCTEDLQNMYNFQLDKISEISHIEDLMYAKDSQMQNLQMKFISLKHKFEVLSKNIMQKVHISEQEFDKMKRKQISLQNDFKKLVEKYESRKMQTESEIESLQSELSSLKNRENKLSSILSEKLEQ